MRSGLAIFVLVSAPGWAGVLSLEQAISHSQERNERAAASRELTAAAEARLTQARAFFFPSLTVNGNYTRRAFETVRDVGGQPTVLQAANALSANATLRWTLFDARGIPLYRAAGREVDATRLESAETRRLLAFEAAEAFLQALSALAVVDAAAHRVDFARQGVKDANARQAAGLGSSNEVTRTQLEAAIADRELTRAKSGAEAARVQLGFLLDLPLAELDGLQRPDGLLELAASHRLELAKAELDQAAASRLDVGAAQARAEQAEAVSSEPAARLFPTVTLTGQVRATNEAGLSGRTGDGFVGVDLSWVLFDGGDRYGERRERRAQAAAAALSARLAQRKVAADVEAALVTLKNAQAAIVQARVAVEVAQKNAAETKELYRQGLSSTLQLSDASLRQFEAEVALAREQYGLALALLDLRAAVGVDPLGREVPR